MSNSNSEEERRLDLQINYLKIQLASINAKMEDNEVFFKDKKKQLDEKHKQLLELNSEINQEGQILDVGIHSQLIGREYVNPINEFDHWIFFAEDFSDNFPTHHPQDKLNQLNRRIGQRNLYLDRLHGAISTLNRELAALDAHIASSRKLLSDIRIEEKRRSNFNAHQLLLNIVETPKLLAGLQPLPALSSPSGYFSKTQVSRGNPDLDGQTLLSRALLSDHFDLFQDAILNKGYIVNEPKRKKLNPLEILRKHLSNIDLLQSIHPKLVAEDFNFLAEGAIKDLKKLDFLSESTQLQIKLLIYLLLVAKIDKGLMREIQKLAIDHADTHFDLTNAYFANEQGNFFELEKKLRFNLLSKIPLENDQNILAWYTTDKTFKINQLQTDFSAINKSSEPVIKMAMDAHFYFDMPEDFVLIHLMNSYYQDPFSFDLRKFTHQYPEITKSWFSRATTPDEIKIELICQNPQIFKPIEILQLFRDAQIENLPDYQILSAKLSAVEAEAKAPVLFAAAKRAINDMNSSEQIRQYTLDLESDWRLKGIPSRYFEVILKTAKNQVIDCLSKLPNEPGNNPTKDLKDFMTKHRIKHKFLGISLPHFFTPSTNIYNKLTGAYYNRLNASEDYEKEREVNEIKKLLS